MLLRRWLPILALIALPALLGGCTTAFVAGAVAEEGAKQFTGEDCAFTNLLKRKAFCNVERPQKQEELHCYRNIAGVSCYATPSGNNTTASRYVAPYPEVEHNPGQREEAVIQGNPIDQQVIDRNQGIGPQVLFPPRVQNKSIHTINPAPQ